MPSTFKLEKCILQNLVYKRFNTSSFSEYRDLYLDGHKVLNNVRINVFQQQVRYGVSFDVRDHPTLAYVSVPYGSIEGKKIYSKFSADSGVGDTTFMFAYWPYVNKEDKSYFAVATYLILPTGSYDHDHQLNIGENRYRTALQLE